MDFCTKFTTNLTENSRCYMYHLAYALQYKEKEEAIKSQFMQPNKLRVYTSEANLMPSCSVRAADPS